MPAEIDVPEDLRQLLAMCWAQDPLDRPTAEQVCAREAGSVHRDDAVAPRHGSDVHGSSSGSHAEQQAVRRSHARTRPGSAGSP